MTDGDTVELSDGRTVRLLGVATPERGECGFDQASAFAREHLLGKQVTATADPTQDATDRYGRSLLYLSAPGVGDYSTAVARAGWAERYVYNNRPVQKDPQIAAAEQAAKAAKAGMWADTPAGCATPPPPPPPPPPSSAAPTAVKRVDDDRRQAPAPAPVPAPAPPPPAPAPPPKRDTGGSVYYKNCSAARAAGAAPVHRGDPGYGSHLDRDGDGIGCE